MRARRVEVAAVVVVAAWAIVSLARLTRLVEPPDPPPGQALAPFVAFAQQTIPSDAGFLYVQPGAFGTDTGDGPRLRYDLYPRRYDDVRAADDEAAVHALLRTERLDYVVVPDASAYPPTHWLRQGRDWLRRVDF